MCYRVTPVGHSCQVPAFQTLKTQRKIEIELLYDYKPVHSNDTVRPKVGSDEPPMGNSHWVCNENLLNCHRDLSLQLGISKSLFSKSPFSKSLFQVLFETEDSWYSPF